MPRQKPQAVKDYMLAYPRIVSHLICESLGYATPSRAASILKDAREGRPNYCEWVWSCYNSDPKTPVQLAIKNRHMHHGYMAEYKLARALVERAIKSSEEPVFASWF